MYQVGDSIDVRQIVDANQAASHLGSGSLQVFATPAMVTFVERTCRQLIEPHLDEGQTSVGVAIAIRHLAPTPTGAEVRAHATILEVDGRFVHFEAQVWDEVELIGEAEHTRAVIDEDRFLKRVAAKT